MPPTPTIQPAFNCASLVPDRLKAPVAGAPLPPADADAGQVWGFADAQTGRLDMANGHTSDVVDIVTKCEAAKAEAQTALKPKRKWWWPF